MELITGLILIAIGILNLYSPLIKWLIKAGNVIEGDRTHITKGTIIWSKVVGIIFLIAGILVIILSINISSSRLNISNPFNWEPPQLIPSQQK